MCDGVIKQITRLPASPPPSILLDDHRFRALLSDEDWGRLPLAIWRRFSKRLADGKTVVYVGEIDEASFSRTGWWLAQLARLIGGPLPTGSETGVPMIVTVTEDAGERRPDLDPHLRAQHGFPQVIHSSKRFAGPTGLEEYVGFGVSMALVISVEDEALFFRSVGYSLQIGRPEAATAGMADAGRSSSATGSGPKPSAARSRTPAST